jgi:hypothetical protein
VLDAVLFYKGISMFYLSLFFTAIAILLFKLGALSVWFSVLSLALIFVAVVAAAVAIYALWKRYKSRTTEFIALRKL